MYSKVSRKDIRSKYELIVGGLIFGVTLLIFWFSPVHQVTDSTYSMLLSENLLKHHSFALDRYAIGSGVQPGPSLRLVNNHLYYLYPPGTSVLSVPFVAVMNAFHTTATNADGTYKFAGELKMQSTLAALLMAFLAGLFFFTARLLLPTGWSLLIALGAALGTQVWSTASRAMWSHTWEILLLGVVIYSLLAQQTGKLHLSPWLLATLLAWMYFVRPTASLPITAITVYVLILYRPLFVKYAVTGAIWLTVLIAYSWEHFGQILPGYYRLPLSVNNFLGALSGTLISPGRGMLVYVPVLPFVFYLVIRYRTHIAYRSLVWLSLFVVLAHVAVIAMSPLWWGGFSFGTRLTTDLVPWFVLLSILGIDAMRKWRERQGVKASAPSWRVSLALGSMLLTLSVFINARGALSAETWGWNGIPKDSDEWAVLLWDWRHPQFMAGLIHLPVLDFPPAETRIDLTQRDSGRYLWYGWSGAEPQFRWTDGHEATFIFGLDEGIR